MRRILLGVAFTAACGSSFAERADALQKIQVIAKTAVINMSDPAGTAEGDVVLTRGTLVMRGGKFILKEDPEGYKFATLIAVPGALATFRQKRDGGSGLWVEGEAERIDYDDKSDFVKLSGRAKVRNLDGSRVTSDAEGAFLSYDGRNEVVNAFNSVTGQSKDGAGRVQITIDNKPHPPAGATGPSK